MMCKNRQDRLTALGEAKNAAYAALTDFDANLSADFKVAYYEQISLLREAAGLPATMTPTVHLEFYSGHYIAQFLVGNKSVLSFARPIPAEILAARKKLQEAEYEARGAFYAEREKQSLAWAEDAVCWSDEYPSLRPPIDAVKAEVDRISAEREESGTY
jgi:hypothetical protein